MPTEPAPSLGVTITEGPEQGRPLDTHVMESPPKTVHGPIGEAAQWPWGRPADEHGNAIDGRL